MSGIKLCLIVIASKNKLVIYLKKKRTKKKGFLRHKLVNYFRKKKL